MPGRSFHRVDSRPVARNLVRQADEALVNGDRDRVAEFVGRLYNLLDWEVAAARQEEADRRASGQARAPSAWPPTH